MSDSRCPSPDVARQLLANLRRSRLEMREVNSQLEEVISRLEQDIQGQCQRRPKYAMEMNEALD